MAKTQILVDRHALVDALLDAIGHASAAKNAASFAVARAQEAEAKANATLAALEDIKQQLATAFRTEEAES